MRLNQYTRQFIFLSAFLLAVSPSFSLNPVLTLSMNGQDITGKSITLEGKSKDELIKASFVLSNTSGKAIQVKVRKSEIKTVPGSLNAFCLGECFPPAIIESPNPFQIAANASTPGGLFYAEYYPNGQAGISEIKYEVIDMANSANTVFVIVRFDAREITGFSQFRKNAPEPVVYPNPLHHGLSTLSLPQLPLLSPARLVISGPAGLTESYIIPPDYANRFKFSLEGKANGIYFIAVFSGNQLIFNDKLIVVWDR